MGNGLTLLVDSAVLIYRALFSVPDTVKAPDGNPMNAAYGFLGMLEGLVSTDSAVHEASEEIVITANHCGIRPN